MELLSQLNWIAVVVASLVYFGLGALWYSPLLFAKKWMALRDLTEEEIGEPNPIIFLYSFILQFIATISLAVFITALGIATAMNGAIIGLGIGAGFLLTLAGTTGIFEDVKMPLHFINNGYHVVGLAIAGAILGVW